jgi:hypothetical protein
MDKWELVPIQHSALEGISLKNACGSVTKHQLRVELTAYYPITLIYSSVYLMLFLLSSSFFY